MLWSRAKSYFCNKVAFASQFLHSMIQKGIRKSDCEARSSQQWQQRPDENNACAPCVRSCASVFPAWIWVEISCQHSSWRQESKNMIARTGQSANVTPFLAILTQMNMVDVVDVAMVYDDPFSLRMYIHVTWDALFILRRIGNINIMLILPLLLWEAELLVDIPLKSNKLIWLIKMLLQ